MEMKKCERCGSFYFSAGNICSACQDKDSYERTLLKNYFEANVNINSIHAISEETGISPNTIENFMSDNNYIDLAIEDNTSINQIPY